MKPLVIYHGGGCTDGFGAAFAAWLKLGDEAEYLPMEYGATYNFDLSGVVVNHVGYEINEREVFILDFSFPREVMDDLFVHAKRVVWLDHHATSRTIAEEMYDLANSHRAYALDVLNRTTSPHYVRLDNNKSGAMLAWHFFHPGTEVPMLIQHIDDRDRWVFALPGSKEIHAALASYKPWSFEQWEARFLVGRIRFGELKDEGAAILRAHNQNVQACLKQTRPCAIRWFDGETDGHPAVNVFTGLAANAPSFLASDLGHELANKSGTFGLVWSMVADGQVHCSLRSNGDYDVSTISKAFGGGGHRNAAGFSTDINTLLSWLK